MTTLCGKTVTRYVARMTAIRTCATILCALTLSLAFALPVAAQSPAEYNCDGVPGAEVDGCDACDLFLVGVGILPTPAGGSAPSATTISARPPQHRPRVPSPPRQRGGQQQYRHRELGPQRQPEGRQQQHRRRVQRRGQCSKAIRSLRPCRSVGCSNSTCCGLPAMSEQNGHSIASALPLAESTARPRALALRRGCRRAPRSAGGGRGSRP